MIQNNIFQFNLNNLGKKASTISRHLASIRLFYQYLLKNATSELARLNAETRSTIESGIKNYQSQNSGSYENIVTGAQQSIITQQTQRENLLEGK